MLPEPTDHAEPFCPYFGVCGGCTLQHYGPRSYAAHKRGVVEEALKRARIDVPVGTLVDGHGAGRRRVTLHTRGRAAGYMKMRSHELLDIVKCPILVPELRETAPAIARQVGAVVGDGDVSFTATATGLDVAVRTGRRIKPERLTLLAQRLGVSRVSIDGEIVIEQQPPTVRVGNAVVEVPAGGFLQATGRAEQVLADFVLAGVGKAKSVADLFCGIGVFALRLAEQARVAAVDSDTAAIAALQKAVRMTQGLKPVTASVRDLIRNPLAPAELAPFDAVVFDPPRQGAEAQSRELARSKVGTVVGVSCEPKTFARDAAILIGGGYGLESVVPVDQFAWSGHVEVIGVFRR